MPTEVAGSEAGAPPTASADAAVKVATRGADGGGRAPPPWLAVPGATAPLLANMGIPDRFQTEQNSRPRNLKISVETVLAALEKAGLNVVEKKQHLGQTFGARYCVGARVVSGSDASDPTQLQLSVCEFISPEVAQGSREYSTEALKMIPNRAIHANQQTTLTVRGESATPEIQAASAKAFATYDALPAP